TYISLNLLSDGETYLSGLSRNTRQQYRRHLRRLGDQGDVRTSVETEPDGVEKRLQEAMVNHDTWWGEGPRADWFGREATRRFTIDGARLLAKRGQYLAYTLDLDKTPIAWNFGAFDGRRYFEHLLSHNPEYRAHSPGATLTLSLIQELIERGASRVEFGPGDHQRKRSAGGMARQHVRFVWYRGWLRSAARLRGALRGRPRSA
ncbi:MAG: GNAT family N-acetyltransferase, partial [Thermoplasmata archaeon]